MVHREKTAIGGAATTCNVFFERPVVNLLFVQPLVCNISIFSLYLIDLEYAIRIPSLGVRNLWFTRGF
jgi:uncharacterized membrane protein (UPF0182 family)